MEPAKVGTLRTGALGPLRAASACEVIDSS